MGTDRAALRRLRTILAGLGTDASPPAPAPSVSPMRSVVADPAEASCERAEDQEPHRRRIVREVPWRLDQDGEGTVLHLFRSPSVVNDLVDEGIIVPAKW